MQTAAQIIDRLGGSARIARATGFPLTTIESWKAANFIPDWRRERLVALGEKLGIAVGDFPERQRASTQRVAA